MCLRVSDYMVYPLCIENIIPDSLPKKFVSICLPNLSGFKILEDFPDYLITLLTTYLFCEGCKMTTTIQMEF